MRNILTKANLATLTHFASSSVLLAFDYDGTLAPIAPNPADARMRATTRQLLNRVARIYPSVVISGRAHHDLAMTIHYRAVRDQAGIRKVVADAIETLPNVRVLAGPQAVNLIPRGGPDKGVALQKARAALACGTAIYIGDDDTDEDAFVSAPRDQLLAIGVGHSRKSGAHFRLNTQAEIDVLLRAPLAVRTVPPAKAVYRRYAQ